MLVKQVIKYLKQALYILDYKMGERYYSTDLKQLIKCIEDEYIKGRKPKCK